MPQNSSESYMLHNIDVSKILIFRNVCDDTLKKLLKDAKINEYRKGDKICSYGEAAKYFHIVISGLVKLFKSNADGDEIVFKVAGKDEPLAEISFSNVYTGNAEAVDDAKILAIPNNTLKSIIHEDKAFAVNMHTITGNCMHNLVAHIEQLTLKTVTQRVGWFLLKLFMEESGESSKNIKLPYDKLLISEYLGMRPETFSRTLQRMKEYGISIDSKDVILTDPKALCNFCTAEIAAKCTNFDEYYCR